eukprot:m51a1_g10577 hypothetical protein (140) ;mRNA; r:2998-4218
MNSGLCLFGVCTLSRQQAASSSSKMSAQPTTGSFTVKSPVMRAIDIPRSEIMFQQSVGGTIYGTTPGGSKRVYSKHEMMHIGTSSPHAKMVPLKMHFVSGVTVNVDPSRKAPSPPGSPQFVPVAAAAKEEMGEMFPMDQ